MTITAKSSRPYRAISDLGDQDCAHVSACTNTRGNRTQHNALVTMQLLYVPGHALLATACPLCTHSMLEGMPLCELSGLVCSGFCPAAAAPTSDAAASPRQQLQPMKHCMLHLIHLQIMQLALRQPVAARGRNSNHREQTVETSTANPGQASMQLLA